MANSKYTPEQVDTLMASDEPIFIIRAKDAHAMSTLKCYQILLDTAKQTEAAAAMDAVMDSVRVWQLQNPDKVQLPTL